MKSHQLRLIQIKSDLMELFSDKVTGYSYTQWFDAIIPILTRNLGINKLDLFVYDDNKKSFIPLQGHKSLIKPIAVPDDLLQNSVDCPQASYLKLFSENGIQYADDIMLIKNAKSEKLAILLIQSTVQWRSFASSTYFDDFNNIISSLILMIGKMSYLEKREKKFRQLYTVAELFNSTMSSEVILEGIINSVLEVFPTFEVNLLLSHEQKLLTNSYKLFDYMDERPSAIDAFVSGEVTIEEAKDLGVNIFNAPIKGKQGIYGVLQMKAPSDYIFSNTHSNLIRMLANTAGSALENASLYDQSHRLNKDLQLVNETSRKLNSNLDFSEMILYIKEQLNKALQPKEIAFVLYNELGQFDLLLESTDFFKTNEGNEYLHFVSKHLMNGKEALFDASFGTTMNKKVPYDSVIAVPITNQEAVIGFIVCADSSSYSFSFEGFKLVRLLIGHSSLAIANSMLRDQLQELVDKDHLTKLYTRRYLDNIVENEVMQKSSGSLLLFDVDDFKKVNDTYGHSVGDIVLKQIASYVRTEVKGECVAARWGGEEFAIYLPSVSEKDAEIFAKRLIQGIPSVTDPAVTVSIGMVNWLGNHQTNMKTLFNQTDTALYAAKSKGKNQVVIHHSPLSYI